MAGTSEDAKCCTGPEGENHNHSNVLVQTTGDSCSHSLPYTPPSGPTNGARPFTSVATCAPDLMKGLRLVVSVGFGI